MDISENCKLFLTDLYFYDIKSAYYQIARSNRYEFNDIEVDDKAKRNIQIGKEQIGNENLAEYLRSTAQNIIETYLMENNINPEDIIVSQTDGCILTKKLRDNKKYLELAFRDHIDFMIITPDRKKFLTISDNKVTVKGIPNRYDSLDKLYIKFRDLNFYNKRSLFKQLNRIKECVTNGEDRSVYVIDRGEKKLIITKKHGIIEVKDGVQFAIKNIDREKYYEMYFKEFMEALFLNFY